MLVFPNHQNWTHRNSTQCISRLVLMEEKKDEKY
jgi:hypothetical protein